MSRTPSYLNARSVSNKSLFEWSQLFAIFFSISSQVFFYQNVRRLCRQLFITWWNIYDASPSHSRLPLFAIKKKFVSSACNAPNCFRPRSGEVCISASSKNSQRLMKLNCFKARVSGSGSIKVVDCKLNFKTQPSNSTPVAVSSCRTFAKARGILWRNINWAISFLIASSRGEKSWRTVRRRSSAPSISQVWCGLWPSLPLTRDKKAFRGRQRKDKKVFRQQGMRHSRLC